ncbi:MAG: isopentenyl phosphate kinase [Pelolinea sp.]|nr:isopentenyl phosphate kinase [Pelolinea sp.]
MLVFLKLGGSLITDKDRPYTARFDVIKRTAEEINKAINEDSDLKVVLGHGSGSFGHFAAMESGFKEGASTKSQWLGFQRVWQAAHELNDIFIGEYNKSGLPVVSFPPSTSISADNKKILEWNTFPIRTALVNNLIPVVFGDTIFDLSLGGVILSTEELFLFLIDKLSPGRIILAGKEPGVWADFPEKKHLIPKITPENYVGVNKKIASSQSIDVTGGMQKKVTLMLEAVSTNPNLSIEIITGEIPGNIYKSLKGVKTGTIIANK